MNQETNEQPKEENKLTKIELIKKDLQTSEDALGGEPRLVNAFDEVNERINKQTKRMNEVILDVFVVEQDRAQERTEAMIDLL